MILYGIALAHQRVFDRARLRVGAIEHRDHRVDVLGARRLIACAMKSASSSSSPPRKYTILRAALAIGPEPLLLAVAVLLDDRRGGVEDHLRRAVVLLEPDDLRVGEVGLEVEDVAQVRAAPLVDRLVGIADDAQVAVDLGEPPDQQVLRAVGVLVLVDHDVPELPA